MYTKIESQFWKDEKMMKLSGDGKFLMLYLLTSPHRNIIGCYFLPEPYACFDLGWSPERFGKALRELRDAGRIKYDEQNYILLIPNYLKFNPLENPNQVKSAIEKLNELPQTKLFQDLLSVIKTIDKSFVKPLIERLQQRLPKPVTVTVNNNSTQDAVSSKQDLSLVPDESGTEEEEQPSPPKKHSKYTYEPEHMELAEQLKFRILDHKPNFKYPNSLDQWANTVRLMIEQDNRTCEEVTAVIDWCQRDNFWQNNILSADKLREKFDQLQAKMTAVLPRGKPPDDSRYSRLSMIENVKRKLASGNQ